MPEIPATKPTEIQGETKVYPRWRIRSFSLTVSLPYTIDATARLTKGNDTEFSPLPADSVEIRIPDLVAHANGDMIQLQQIATIDANLIAYLSAELDRRGIR